MIKLNAFLFIGMFVSIMISSCSNSKQLAYFQDLMDTSTYRSVNLYPFTPLVLQPDDQLQIIISSISPEASQYFNLMSATPTSEVAGVSSAPRLNFQNVYTINSSGYISLPILGEFLAGNKTTQQLKDTLYKAVKEYLKDAVVSVRLMNFKVTVIGEVLRPTIVPVDGERMNVLQALGAAGDMTPFAHRFNVKVIRKVSDSLKVGFLNFNKSAAISSPFFQLRQNDVVYVEPSKNKGFFTEKGALLIPLITSIITALSVFLLQVR